MSTSGFGAYAIIGASPSGYGVFGNGHIGVHGTGDLISGYGVIGDGYTGVYGAGDQSGVLGEVSADGATGVHGINNHTSSGFGVLGNGPVGVRGYSESNSGFGTVGWNHAAGVGVGAWSSFGNLVEAYDGNYPDGTLRFYIDQNGNVYAYGGFYGLVPSPTVDEPEAQRAVSAIQSPEVWIEDFGTAALAGGQAVVSLEPVFASLVNLEAGYHIYLTPLGDCQGLYVADKTATSFEVRELGGGKANVSFDYRIVTRQAGYEGVRLEQVVIEGQAEPERRPLPEGGSHD